MLICTLSTQFTAREYFIIDASHGFASVELRSPSTRENPAAFDVPVEDIASITQLDDDGRVVGEYDPSLPKNIRVFDAEYEDSLDAKFAWRN
jgi:hypothetical protein